MLVIICLYRQNRMQSNPRSIRSRLIPLPVRHDDHQDIRDAVRKLCEKFPNEYWRDLDRELFRSLNRALAEFNQP